MADATNGLRGTGSYPPNQRSGGFKTGMKSIGARVSREDVIKRIGKKKRKRK